MLEYNMPYEKLSSTENASVEDTQKQTLQYARRPSIATCILSFTTILFGAQSLYLWSRPEPACGYALGEGYPTEWGPAVEAIKLEKTIFTSPLCYNATSNELYREFDPSQPQYVGTPSPEIDAAWESLLGGQYLVLSDEEAKELDAPVPIDGRWIGEVEVMHSLHCLNTLRKALSPEYYGGGQHFAHTRLSLHLEHCFEQVRQSIQCAGDLTPVVLRPLGEDSQITVVGTPMAHTCRSWDALRTWYTQRGSVHGSLD